jgi:hypothetical protein
VQDLISRTLDETEVRATGIERREERKAFTRSKVSCHDTLSGRKGEQIFVLERFYLLTRGGLISVGLILTDHIQN